MAQANMEAVERIKAARSKSLRLMRMDKEMNTIAKSNQGSINEGISTGEAVLMPNRDRQMSQMPMQGAPMRESASKLPKEILESFKTTQIDEAALMNGLLDDGRNLSMLENNNARVPKQIREEYNPQQQVRSQVSEVSLAPSQVDYPMIKMIVEDVVKRQMSSLSKKLMNESKESLNELSTITIGKTFKFLAKDGTIYEATLKKVGNINESKK